MKFSVVCALFECSIGKRLVTVRSEFDPRGINISFLHLYSSIVFDGAFGGAV